MRQKRREKTRPESERVVCGLHAVECYLERGEVTRLFVTSAFRHNLVKRAKSQGIPVGLMRRSELDLFAAGENHQGVVAFIRGYPYLDLPQLLELLAPLKEPMVLFLDRLTDPHNLGAIARSAYLLGAQGIVIPLRGSASITVGAVKTSSGATGHIPITRVVNMGKALERFAEEGYKIGGLVAQAPNGIASTDLTGRLVLVVGSEDRGIRPALLERLTHPISIPMCGEHIGSFNASVAASIVLYEARRQRGMPPG